ncbi:uncharacterized protein LOC129568677 isoform X2 [Sitodiplosis mosellana]|uniref:uncharacterized protein LOC129568677 isoform X2 n=1 Tax=Sitodiplosis mosellana TaxID=263140 RepID=UPI0024452D0C|nr:uncharacterized protein LOC129568677 isoform X2 [Sitodiplosis mosellana]XP_055302842.1 uncharacterized protein LOC129568677 isoform X2 [Sitodiplosis mosellana]
MANEMVSNGKNMQGFVVGGATSGLTRERSFVRTQNHQNKRRSLAFTMQHDIQQQQQHQQLRSKRAIEIYRPPNGASAQNKLNVNAPEFTVNRDVQNTQPVGFFSSPNAQYLQHSKSSGNIQHQIQLAVARHHAEQMTNINSPRTILVSHPIQLQRMGLGVDSVPSSTIPMSSTASKVKFADQTGNQELKSMNSNNTNTNSLQRSKSLSSADALARGIASLGLVNVGCTNEANDIGTFKPEIQAIVEQALIDPNKLNARTLMVLANQIMQRAVEGRRFALPASRFCITIIAKEQKETYLEALLNTCRLWYQERGVVLGSPQKIKNSARPRFTAFMAFLTEMFCQLKRRQLQLRTKCDGVPPPIVLLTVLSKCCEESVRSPVRSLSEIECLFYVLTCVGRDIETHLPQQLEILLSLVRDAFLNSSASAPTIRRTLLMIIELQASHWQLSGNTVLYYYPTTK